MGIRKIFQKKDPTEQELRDDLNKVGIATKSTNGRQEKFSAFKQYAQERHNMKPGLAPVNPYANMNSGEGGNDNPYAEQENGNAENPRSGSSHSVQSSSGSDPYSKRSLAPNPYSSHTSVGSPYARDSQSLNPYAPNSQALARSSSSINDNQLISSSVNPYASTRTGRQTNFDSQSVDPYNRGGSKITRENTRDTTQESIKTSKQSAPRRARDFDEETLDLNEIPSNPMFALKKPIRRHQTRDDETLDLNDVPEEDDLNVDLDDLPEEEQVNSEDEEIEAIKQDIRFVKQESLALTRNTLRMAQEADASGSNTLGMLGSQSERLYNAEQNLLLADTQTQIADEKVRELKRLNRLIFIPAYGNPFNKKSRLAQREEKIKNSKAQEKYLRETNRKNMYDSEQRIKQGITQNATSSDVHQKYQGERDLQAAQRYQFENDSEDDEIEKELASNLDQIGLYAKKLKSSANTMGQEVDSQNSRLRQIEEDTDRLDINVHMNNTRLSNIH
ncbi:uncharacterized protein PRCAT00002901001 [Priceomyces carsonii]|uniref:uncharacterized protein n=1 Tax=Priceomyces carsonii TaxID=28549 RepID=UPI002ED83746|nr:unnamed protein product [Priceomyces carsonii]